MDLQQQMMILQNIESIWRTLSQGDQLEQKMSSLLFIIFRSLKAHWLNIQIKIAKPTYSKIDKVEYFLNHIADLD